MNKKLALGCLVGVMVFVFANSAFASDTLFDVDANTVALWRFNETSGSSAKDETGINTGIPIGSPTFVPGEFGNAISFNGENQYVSVPDNHFLRDLSQITIEAWVYPSGFDLNCWNNQESIVIKGAADVGNAYSLRIWRNQDDSCAGATSLKQIQFSAGFGNGGTGYSSWKEPNNWYYVAFAYDGEIQKLYINGNLESEGFYPNEVVSNNSDLFINHHTWSGGSSSGRLIGVFDEVRISNVARSEAEIKANYENATKRPVILVPGILGSWWSGYFINLGKLELDPLTHVYDGLINLFTYNDYPENKWFFAFPYDWRQSNSISAQQLADKIKEVKAKCGCDKVDIIAHSMGGLVVRQYLESVDYANDVGKVAFLGTPQMGAPKAYLMWEAGEDKPGKTPTRLETAISILAHEARYPNRFSYIRNYPLKSLQELLPVYDYLVTTSSQTKIYPNEYPRNAFLDTTTGLNSATGLSKLFQTGAKLFAFVGNGVPTLKNIKVTDNPKKLPLWEDGYPENYDSRIGDHGFINGMGDETVPYESASSLSNSVEEIDVYSSHANMPSAERNIIFEKITGHAPQTQVSSTQINSNLLIVAGGTAKIEVIDVNGKKVGFDKNNPKGKREISQSFFGSLPDSPSAFISVPNPAGEYKLTFLDTSQSRQIELYYISDRGETEKTMNLNPNQLKQGLKLKVINGDSENPIIQSSF